MTVADASTPPPLHELEARVMDIVWDHDTMTVREALEVVNAQGRKALAYTTIMTIMGRLHQKGVLDRERNGRTDVYRARHSREEYMELRARAEVDALVEQFGDTALLHFTRQVQKLDPKRRDQLRRMAR